MYFDFPWWLSFLVYHWVVSEWVVGEGESLGRWDGSNSRKSKNFHVVSLLLNLPILPEETNLCSSSSKCVCHKKCKYITTFFFLLLASKEKETKGTWSLQCFLEEARPGWKHHPTKYKEESIRLVKQGSVILFTVLNTVIHLLEFVHRDILCLQLHFQLWGAQSWTLWRNPRRGPESWYIKFRCLA